MQQKLGDRHSKLSVCDLRRLVQLESTPWCSRRFKGHGRFLASLEKQFNTTKLKPKNVPVTFNDGTVGTVSVFDIEEQINALLTNPELMQEKNLA
jgi:hypothetical protein